MKEQRKLAAIMFTDIVGFTALMSKNEKKALKTLQKNRDLQKPLIKQFNGEWLKEMGDGTLSSFQSAVDAVNCALEIQRSLKDDPDLTLRIGIHIGDVVFSGGDVFGDGVNVASRIERLAEPGGVTVSERVYDDIRNKPYIEAVFIGEQELKYIDNPIKVYALTGGDLPLTTIEKTTVSDIRDEIKVGTTISHYRIVEKLGEGGMGVVYKAEDTKLKRTVALKFLRPEVVGSAEQKTRFINEAQAAASLSHPNICTIHEIDEYKGHTFIAMEFIEGISLRKKIQTGPLKTDEALDIAMQAAEGLQEAHGKGTFHRDIKPDNILLTKSGHPKIVDFGIAKHAGSSKLTKEGTAVGTVAYMSPEQVRGKTIDHRTDIWSLGVVLYEKLTGHPPFKGANDQAVMYSILNEEPEQVQNFRPELSSNFTYVLNRALEKKPANRYQSASDMLIDLRRLKRDTSKIITRAKPAPTIIPFVSSKKRSFIYAVTALFFVVLMVVFYFLWKGEGVPPVPRLTNPTRIATSLALEDSPTWSPDGGRLAYQSNQSGNSDIWVKQAGVGNPVNLTADYTGSDQSPRWSPDGSQIAFVSSRDGGGCFVMPAVGGTPYKVYAGTSGPCWSPDGQEIARTRRDSAGRFIEIISLQGGTPRRLNLQVRGNESPMHLSWSPDGRYFAYVSVYVAGWYFAHTSQLFLLRVADEECFPVTDGEMKDWQMTWSRDGSTLYFVSNRGGIFDLWQQSLSDDGKPVGSPQQVTTGQDIWDAKFSPDGKKLAYVKGPFAGIMANMWRVPILKDRPATWADAKQLTFKQAFVQSIDVSPDGKQLVFHSNIDGVIHIWKMPVEGGEIQRVTIDPMEEHQPKWSPDGREIAFYSSGGGLNSDIYVVPVGGGPTRRVTYHETYDRSPTWSPDGSEIVFVSDRSGNSDIWIIPAQGGKARQVTVHPASDIGPKWSPDGKWILFRTNRTGDRRLWRVPSVGGLPEPITEGSALTGIWSHDGKKVYFRAEREGALNFWEVSAEGSAERQLTDFVGKYGELSFEIPATDGKYIYFTWDEDISDIWVMDVVENE